MKYLKLFEDIEDFEEDWEEEGMTIFDYYPKDFLNFLIDNDILETYHKCLLENRRQKKRNLTSSESLIKDFFLEFDYQSYVIGAFGWSTTGKPPGYEYWVKLHNEWVKLN